MTDPVRILLVEDNSADVYHAIARRFLYFKAAEMAVILRKLRNRVGAGAALR